MQQFFLRFALPLLMGCTLTPNSGLLYLPLETAGPPAAEPILVVEAAVIDATTHQPIKADIYIVNATQYREPTLANLVLHTTQRFEIQLPPQSDSWIVVRAHGYQDWALRFHYSLRSSRKLTGPIQLQRLPVEQQQITFADL